MDITILRWRSTRRSYFCVLKNKMLIKFQAESQNSSYIRDVEDSSGDVNDR